VRSVPRSDGNIHPCANPGAFAAASRARCSRRTSARPAAIVLGQATIRVEAGPFHDRHVYQLPWPIDVLASVVGVAYGVSGA